MSLTNKTSRYVSGGITEVQDNKIYYWERNYYPVFSNDTLFEITKQYEQRLDKISYAFYNNTEYWWVIALYNNILNPLEEIEEGRILRLPTKENLLSLLNGRVNYIN